MTNSTDNSAVIIANGTYPTHPLPLSYVENAKFIVCCDGAANDFISTGGIPDAIVGDCDSISEQNKVLYSDILYQDKDQYTNDLTKSVRFCLSRGKDNIIIVGGTGKREDHTLGNISLLAEYMLEANVLMVTNNGILTPINTNTVFNSFIGEQVSFFSIDFKPITTRNLAFPLYNEILTNWWQGTLNESLGNSFEIETTGRVIVFQVFK